MVTPSRTSIRDARSVIRPSGRPAVQRSIVQASRTTGDKADTEREPKPVTHTPGPYQPNQHDYPSQQWPPAVPAQPTQYQPQPGYPPPPGYPVRPPSPPKKKSGAGKVIGIVIAAVVVLCGVGVVLTAVNGGGNGGQTAGSVASPAAPVGGPATTAAAAAATTKAAAPQPPKTLLQLTGSGIKKSNTFTTGDEWTLSYSFNCSNFGSQGNFAVMEYDSSGMPTDVLVNELAKSGTDSVPQHVDGGGHYLQINSECKWSLTVTG